MDSKRKTPAAESDGGTQKARRNEAESKEPVKQQQPQKEARQERGEQASSSAAQQQVSQGPTRQEVDVCLREHKLARQAMLRAQRKHGVESAQYARTLVRLQNAANWLADVRARFQRHYPMTVAVLTAR